MNAFGRRAIHGRAAHCRAPLVTRHSSLVTRHSSLATLVCLVLAFGLTLPIQQTRVAAGATYYVAPSGADTNDCLSQGTPCLTIGAAVDKTAPGDTVAVAGGSYHEHVVIAHDVTLTGAGAAATIVDGTGLMTGTLVSVEPSATAVISGLTVQYGLADEGYGGGVTSGGALTLMNAVLQDNSGGSAGGLYQFGGAVTVINSVVSGNDGDTGGMAVTNGGLTVMSSTVNANSGSVGGIGVDNAALTLTSATVSGNSGGGILNGGVATLVNSTIGGNIGIGLDNVGVSALYNSTVSGNSRTGILSEGHTPVSLANTIVGDNIGPDCVGILASQGYNLLGSGDGCSGLVEGVDGDRVGLDPRLGPLGDNGGPTATRALLPGSAAIDGGNPGGCMDENGRAIAIDQRGLSRPDSVNRRCDIGAYEEQSPPPGVATPVPTATNAPPTAVVTPSPSARATITPTPRVTAHSRTAAPPPLTLHLGGHIVTSGDTLAIRLGTDARARVRITLQATASKTVMAGSGKSRHRVTRHVVLYQTTLTGTANARGGYSARLRVGYRPAKPVQASLSATIQTSRGHTTRTAAITIDPPRQARSRGAKKALTVAPLGAGLQLGSHSQPNFRLPTSDSTGGTHDGAATSA